MLTAEEGPSTPLAGVRDTGATGPAPGSERQAAGGTTCTGGGGTLQAWASHKPSSLSEEARVTAQQVPGMAPRARLPGAGPQSQRLLHVAGAQGRLAGARHSTAHRRKVLSAGQEARLQSRHPQLPPAARARRFSGAHGGETPHHPCPHSPDAPRGSPSPRPEGETVLWLGTAQDESWCRVLGSPPPTLQTCRGSRGPGAGDGERSPPSPPSRGRQDPDGAQGAASGSAATANVKNSKEGREGRGGRREPAAGTPARSSQTRRQR